MGVQMAAQTDFASHWIATHFQAQLEQAFTQILGQPASLSVVVAPTDGAAYAGEPGAFAEDAADRGKNTPCPAASQNKIM